MLTAQPTSPPDSGPVLAHPLAVINGTSINAGERCGPSLQPRRHAWMCPGSSAGPCGSFPDRCPPGSGSPPWLTPRGAIDGTSITAGERCGPPPQPRRPRVDVPSGSSAGPCGSFPDRCPSRAGGPARSANEVPLLRLESELRHFEHIRRPAPAPAHAATWVAVPPGAGLLRFRPARPGAGPAVLGARPGAAHRTGRPAARPHRHAPAVPRPRHPGLDRSAGRGECGRPPRREHARSNRGARALPRPSRPPAASCPAAWPARPPWARRRSGAGTRTRARSADRRTPGPASCSWTSAAAAWPTKSASVPVSSCSGSSTGGIAPSST